VAQREENAPDPERVEREARGRWSEVIAAAFLIAHGYRILARRERTPYGEIDLIARRGRRIAFIEVKYRRTRDAAYAALTPQQAQRVARAADHWISKRPVYAEYEQTFDAVLVLPRAWPQLVRDAYQPVGTSGRHY
jgi:putative endonuclease